MQADQSGLVERLKRYNRWASELQTDPETRWLVYSTLRHPAFHPRGYVGGLADRLKGIFSSYFFAVASGRRFLIHWEDPQPLSRNFRCSEFEWAFVQFRDQLRHQNDGSRLIDHFDGVDNPPAHKKISISNIDDIFRERVCFINSNVFSLDVLRNLSLCERSDALGADDVKRLAFASLFEFNSSRFFPEHESRYADLIAGGRNVVGVHLRTGAGNGWRDEELSDAARALEIVASARAEAFRRGLNDPAILFLSDSEEARKRVKAEFGDSIMIPLDDISHLDRSEHISQRSNDLAFYEFELLSRTDLVIGTRGQYAMLAANIGEKPFVRLKVSPEARPTP